MIKLKLRALQIGAAEVPTREQLKTVLGGSGGGQCDSPSGCLTTACTISGGLCDGKPGTCGGTTKCTRDGGCAG